MTATTSPTDPAALAEPDPRPQGVVATRREFLSLIRFSHTIFALPFALLAAVLAWRVAEFQWRDLLGVLLCMVFARSAAMAFNRFVDHRIDAENPRTAGRHLPSGRLGRRAVLAFILASSAGFVASTLLFLPNTWPLVLSGPVLAFLLGYSYAKRFTRWCHYWLSAALMLSPIAAYLAITGTVTVTPLLLAAVIFFWVGGFDILYACQDADFDRERGLWSARVTQDYRAAAFKLEGCYLWFFIGTHADYDKLLAGKG